MTAKKILISFMAYNEDFIDRKNFNIEDGPNFLLHQYYVPEWKPDNHYLLYSKDVDETKATHLYFKLREESTYKDCIISSVCMDITDPIDINQIYHKLSAFLADFSETDEIHILYSTGTHSIHAAWMLCAATAKNVHLIQYRPANFCEDNKPHFMDVQLKDSIIAQSFQVRNSESYEAQPKTGFVFWWEKSVWGESLQEAQQMADAVAQHPVSALILGENGTGKEGIARYIHQKAVEQGLAKDHFVALNCSAFTDNLLRSELFGYKKGAFTGADKDKKGLLEEAKGGTLFLDEFGDISPYMQQMMLRVLQEKEYTAVGGTKVEKVDTRIIFATNKDLLKSVEEGTFREDLYYRIAVAEIELPPLRKRSKEEREELMNELILLTAKDFNTDTILKLEPSLYTFLLQYHFPGNIRELRHLIQTLFVKTKTGKREANHFDLPSRFKGRDLSEQVMNSAYCPYAGYKKWKEIERIHLKEMLKLKLSQKQLTEELGYGSVNTLKKKLEEYNLGS